VSKALRRVPPRVFLVAALLVFVYSIAFSPAGDLFVATVTGAIALGLTVIGIWRIARP
jgi:hypothetical protein